MALIYSRARNRPPEVALREDDHFAAPYLGEDERSHFTAFLMGGGVVAGGLLAFLYYDAGTSAYREPPVVSSIARSDIDAPVPSITVPPTPPR